MDINNLREGYGELLQVAPTQSLFLVLNKGQQPADPEMCAGQESGPLMDAM